MAGFLDQLDKVKKCRKKFESFEDRMESIVAKNNQELDKKIQAEVNAFSEKIGARDWLPDYLEDLGTGVYTWHSGEFYAIVHGRLVEMIKLSTKELFND